MMRYKNLISKGLGVFISLLCLMPAFASDKNQTTAAATTKAKVVQPKQELEPKALDVLKKMSSQLAEANALSFTALISYEHPSLVGPALLYTTKSQVTMQRPDKLRVITSGDGPASEFYYNGKEVLAYSPDKNWVAIAQDPPKTIEGVLKAAFNRAAIYFPFTDVIVNNPYNDLSNGLNYAFYIGQSNLVGNTTTDMIAYATKDVFVQAWVGVNDNLPRMMRAVYRADPQRLRNQIEFSDWKVNPSVNDSTFTSEKAKAAKHIDFGNPALTSHNTANKSAAPATGNNVKSK